MSEIDDLMDLDPLSLSTRDLDAIVQYHRNQRANADAPKGKRAKGPNPDAPKIDVASFIAGMTKKEPTAGEVEPPKPQGGGFRRI